MDTSWIFTSFSAALMVAISALGIYLGLMLLTRLAGLRSFAKISAFDFAVTVAIGSVVATTVLAEDPPLLQALAALASLYGLQMLVAVLRQYSPLTRAAVENPPLLLMDGDQVLRDNLRMSRMTEADLRAKLREANVLHPGQIRAVVMESTGDVSVLHGEAGDSKLDRDLLEGVKGA